MSSPFSQTTRSLDADTLRGALLAWVPAVVMLAAWAVWFVGAHVTGIAVAAQARVEATAAGLRVVAAFAPADAIGRVHPGQAAWLHVAGGRADVSARVRRVAATVEGGQLRVELEPLGDAAATLRPGLAGTAEVAVGQATPAALLAHALGGPAP